MRAGWETKERSPGKSIFIRSGQLVKEENQWDSLLCNFGNLGACTKLGNTDYEASVMEDDQLTCGIMNHLMSTEVGIDEGLWNIGVKLKRNFEVVNPYHIYVYANEILRISEFFSREFSLKKDQWRLLQFEDKWWREVSEGYRLTVGRIEWWWWCITQKRYPPKWFVSTMKCSQTAQNPKIYSGFWHIEYFIIMFPLGWRCELQKI